MTVVRKWPAFLGLALAGCISPFEVLSSTHLPELHLTCASLPSSAVVVSVTTTGAVGDGVADDTAAIQRAVDRVAGTGGTVWVPEGTYLIDAVTSVQLKSNMTFRMSPGAVLKAVPNTAGTYRILLARDTTGVNVIGGTLKGERDEHLADAGQFGMGLSILGGQQVQVEATVSRENWGDGFYVGLDAREVKLCSVVADGNRRNGATVSGATTVLIQDAVFQNNRGTNPQDGLDIQANPDQSTIDVRVTRSHFANNGTAGIRLIGADGQTGNGPIQNTIVEGNIVEGNDLGVLLTSSVGSFVTDNTIIARQKGIALSNSSGNTIKNNDITVPGNPDAGLSGSLANNLISGNLVH